MRRRLVYFLLAGVAVLVAALATVPWWWGMALSSAGSRFGLQFENYDRIGYGRFALHGATFTAGRVVVKVDQAETDTPALWLWRRFTSSPSEVLLGNWSVEVGEARSAAEDGTVPTATAQARGWIPLRGTLQRIAGALGRWLPRATAKAGTVRWPGGGLQLAAATWSTQTLHVRQLEFRSFAVDASLHVPVDADELRLTLRAADGSYGARLQSEGPRVTGSVEWWSQPVLVRAEFAAQGWLPKQAVVAADEWAIPGSRLKLEGYFREVRGRTRLDWSDERFTFDWTAHGEPVPNREQIPVLDAAVRAHGELGTVTVDLLNIVAPGITARLSEPVTMNRDGAFRAGTARFDLEADLASQPWLQATGRVQGEARLVPGGARDAVIDFSLRGERLATQGVEVAAAEAKGRWHWPQIIVETGNLTGSEGDRLEWHGGWDFRSRTVLDAGVAGTLRGRTLARWLPTKMTFESVSVRATASGALDALAHEGLAAGNRLTFAGIKPLDFKFTWRGQGLELPAFDAQISAGRTGLSAAGSGSRTGLRLDRLELNQDGVEQLHLTEAAQVRWDAGFQVESLRLRGPASSLDVALSWGGSGRLELAARGIPSTWLRDFVPLPDVGWELKLMAVSGSWERGPMNFSATASGEATFGRDHRVEVMTAMRGGSAGVNVEALHATESGATVLNASGVIPLVVRPAGQPVAEFDPNGRIEFKAVAAPHAQFWAQLAALTGIELQEPDGELSLSGTWSRPEGMINLKAAKVAVDATRFKRPIPLLEGLDLQLTGDRSGARLVHLTVKVEGQAVRAAGSFSVPSGGWSAVRNSPLELAKIGSEFQVELPSTEVAAFSRFLPGFVAPTGRLELKISYRRGEFDGFVRLREAASRPLGPLGVLQEITADAQLQGRLFVLREVTAKSGGQPVKLTGTIEVPESGMPRYDLVLQGENLPFARQAGLLLRGDVDLKLRSPATGVPKLTGVVRLRDSLFLADIRSFVPSGAQTAARRPPYFAISTPPIDAWPIDVEVTGRRFLRVRTPVFNGVASASFRLSGTLGEPRAIGDAKLDEGRVLMPFASFELQQGVVRLTEANPDEPTLFVRGTGRRFGYNLTLEVDGSASAPNVVLSSSPALDSEQVLLMVMTGAPPTDEISASTTQRMTRLGTFLGQTILGGLGGDTANADRLSISSGDKISRQGKETYEIEYKLSERLKLVGEYNEFDEQNAGLKWRIFPRRRDPQEGGGEAK